ncbi:MAG: SMC family ATPase [Cyanobacteria bacterium SZAS LIN-3]|nr:SMC family ATPase [Cyanobacteria bacterium SZAS LIN-3]
MSYADATLDLSGISVACLTGLNGAGKSALLDAVTWALWEEARSGSDELVRLGEKEMWVEVVFSHEGRLYRVRRSRQKAAGKAGGRGMSKGTLELMVAERGSESGHYDGLNWTSMTSASMKETGKHIQDLLRMDFDTFVNSAYLKQGRAEEFTTRPPSERKQVLSEILGLSYFDRLQEETRSRLRDKKARAEQMEASLKVQSESEDKLSLTEDELTLACKDVEEQGTLLLEVEGKLAELTESVARLKVVEATVAGNENRQRDMELGLKRLIDQKTALTTRLAALTQTIADGGDIAEQLTRFNAVRAEVETLDQLALKVQELTEVKVNLSGELARERSRLELSLEQVNKEVAELSRQREKLQKEVSDEEKVNASYIEYKNMLATEAELTGRQEAYVQLTVRINDLSNAIQESRIRLEAELMQKERALAEVEDLTGSTQSLSREGEELEALKADLDRLEVEFDLIEKNGLTIKADIASATAKIEELRVRQRENLEKIRELKEHEHSSICPLCSAPIVDRAAVIDRYLKQNEDMDKEIANIEASVSEFENQLVELRKKYTYTRKELEKRKDLDNRIGRFNEREKAVERARQSGAKLAQERAELSAKLTDNNFAQVERESLINLKAELTKLEFDPAVFTSLQSQIRLKRHVEARYQQLHRELDELARINEKLPRSQEERERLSVELNTESYGAEVRAKLKTTLEEIEALAYDRHLHGKRKEELKELFVATEKSRDLARAIDDKPRVEEELTQLTAEIQERERQIEIIKDEQWRLSADLAQLSDIKVAILGLNPTLEELRERKQEASLRVAVLTERKQSFEQELAAYKDQLIKLAVLKEEIEDLVYLAEAFGKKGIQAVIIENAIPEIEAESNRILSRLTDNKMHVALITQAKNKSGGMSETLDLVMGDEVGTRNYELYSGGEAFKVNFALRIALSRLLARRAGAKLETLIIDEGFGSQDDGSRDRLVKAIRLIQSDFSRVLVITHISDVKDMFPVQIQVSKKNGVSSFKLVS